MSRHRNAVSRRRGRAAALSALLAVLASTSSAVRSPHEPGVPPEGPDRSSPILKVEPTLEWVAPESETAAGHPGLAAFLAVYGESWEIVWDRRNDRPHLLQGSGVPLVPGAGNSLTARELGIQGAVELGDVEAQVRRFLDENPELFGDAEFELRLDETRSAGHGKERQLWWIELQQLHAGLPVEGAGLFFRLAQGNATQLGARRLAPVKVDPRPSTDADEAFAAAAWELELESAKAPEAELGYLPVMGVKELPGQPWDGEPGSGYGHRLVWTWRFEPPELDGEWRLRVDAHSGEILELHDTTRYAEVRGDVQPMTPNDTPVSTPLPFMEVGLNPPGTTVYTDGAGQYVYPGPGTQAAARMFGEYVKIYASLCGNIWLSDSTTGDIDFLGVPASTNYCDAPPIGGAGNAGNTNAARTAYFHQSNQHHEGRIRLNGSPTSSTPFPWLAAPVNTYTDMPLSCNAMWAGGNTWYFSAAPGTCNNTGENRGVVVHEWGHGVDANTGGPAADEASGEALGDTFAFLDTQDGCVGRGFYLGGLTCVNCDPACDSVRDLPSFSAGGVSTIARPSTVEALDGIHCGRYQVYDPDTMIDYLQCPYGYEGPMGYQGHCESYIASTANWDLKESLVSRWGAGTGWATMENLWWASVVPGGSAYRVAAGGQCNPEAQVDGCASDNWYRVLLQADDDNGNLADGTPNGCRIWDAYSLHGIACGTRPVCSADAPCAVPPSQLHAFWPMDSINVSITPELVASNHAALQGAPQPIWGRVGPALAFDGTDDYLAASDCSTLDLGTGDFTLAAWVRTTGAYGTILAKRTRSGSQYLGYLLQIIGSRPLLQMADPAGNWMNFTSPALPAIDDGQWHLVAVSVDRDNPSGGRFYVDANPAVVFDPTPRQGSLDNAAELRMGRSIGDGFDAFLDGDLDEVQVFKRALGAAEVQAIFAAGASGQCKRLVPQMLPCSGGTGGGTH